MHITAPNIQLCASHVLTGIEAMPTPNGGSACADPTPGRSRNVTLTRISVTAERRFGRGLAAASARS